MDQSGQTGAPDILAVIDLLNGAGAFQVWNGTSRPVNTSCTSVCEAFGGTGGAAAQSSGSSTLPLLSAAAGTIVAADNNAAFADGFVSYLTQTTIGVRSNEAEVTTIVRALTGWCVGHFTADERRALADRISNASLTFADARMQAFAPDIVAALRP